MCRVGGELTHNTEQRQSRPQYSSTVPPSSLAASSWHLIPKLSQNRLQGVGRTIDTTLPTCCLVLCFGSWRQRVVVSVSGELSESSQRVDRNIRAHCYRHPQHHSHGTSFRSSPKNRLQGVGRTNDTTLSNCFVLVPGVKE